MIIVDQSLLVRLLQVKVELIFVSTKQEQIFVKNLNIAPILGAIVPRCERECAARNQRMDGAPLGRQKKSSQYSQSSL